MTNEPINQDRANWAKQVLVVFTNTTFSGDRPASMDRDDLRDAVGDLICDLMHFAHQQQFNVADLLQQGCGNFAFELLDESLSRHSMKGVVP
jgi:hypothetical protein